jgi:drug/metabolite transporter (DMT)-like permease
MLNFSSRHQPVLQVLCGAFLISFSGVFVKLADVSPTASGFYRVFFGAIFLLGATFWQKELKKIFTGHLPLIVLCSFIFALDLFFWHESIIYIGPGLATLVSNFQVFLLAAIGILFLGERARPRFLASIPLAVLGLLLIVGLNWNGLENDYKLGVYFGLLTAVCYTAFILILRKIQTNGNHSLFSSLLLISVGSAIFLGAKMVYTGDSFNIPNSKSLLALLGLGLFSQSIGWVFIAKAMPRIRASLTGLILLLQPTLSFIWDVILFNRPTNLLNWAGVALTLAAIYMGVTGKMDKHK